MTPNDKIRIFNTDAKVYLDYDLSILQEILDFIRLETGTAPAEMLRQYEHKLIEAKRLEENRLSREAEARVIETVNRDLE